MEKSRRRDLNPSQKRGFPIGNQQIPDPGATLALPEKASDPDLATVIEQWPDLPDPIRAAILTMVRALAKGGS
jgi:hypothetical protein